MWILPPSSTVKLLNSGNVSGHHLACSNKTVCWSSFVSFVASFLSVQFCYPCHLSLYSRWLSFLIWTLNPSPASCGLIDHHAFFTDFRKINVCLECGTLPPRDLLFDYVNPVVLHRTLMPHCLSPSLECFCQNFPEVSVDMTTTPTCCPLLALFVRTLLCLHPSMLDPDSVSLRLASNNSTEGSSSPRVANSSLRHPIFSHFDWVFKTF